MIVNIGDKKTQLLLSLAKTPLLFSPWMSMSVLWDGRVVTCCMDSNGVQVIGDLNSQSVQDVWNGPVLAGVRDNFRKLDYGKYPVCLSCDWVRRR